MFVLYENDSQLLVIIFFNILGNNASLQVQNFSSNRCLYSHFDDKF